MKYWLINIVFLIATQMAFSQVAVDTATYKPVEYPKGYTAQLNTVYTTVQNWEGKMDFYLPPNTGKPTAIVINIHGGGWNHGVKESQTGFSTFFKANMAVANMEYRLTGQATAPAAVQDARCALIYIIKNAKALNVAVDKIVIMGGSAGGHLALMAGLLANDHKFDTNCSGVDKIKVAAIINKYGITDVWDWAYGKNITSKSAVNWLGKYAKDSVFAASVSPIHYVTKNSPPVFIVHGDADPTVPYQHSVDLHNKLKTLGVKEKNSELNKAMIAFLKQLNIN
jgi:acetyl esterase/lipase